MTISASTESSSRPGAGRRSASAGLVAGVLLGAVALIVVHLALEGSYWNSEEGVYALTARLLLGGHELYRQTVAAQPPATYLVGAAVLAIHDGLEWLRLGVAALQLAAGVLAGAIVWRTTESRAASVATPAVALLTPWAVHEHGSLTPELVSLPLLLGALLACRRQHGIALAGLLCGLLPLVKVPYALPALVIVLCSMDVRRAGLWAIAAFAVGLLGTFLLGGGAFWRDAMIAQAQTGFHSLGELKGWWLQAAWTLSGLVVCCLLAAGFRDQASDREQLRAVLVTSVAMLLLLLSDIKNGTGLNVTVPVEAVLVPGAVSGLVLAVRAGTHGGGRYRWTAALAVGAAVFTLAQSISLMVSPTDPKPFLRIGSSRVGWAVLMTRSQFHRAVDAARACPAGSVYGGPPLIAFAAERRVPDDQPDGLITTAPVLHAVRERIDNVRNVCG